MSMPVMIGDTTSIAKNTFPALSNMFDTRSNWLEVSTGAFGAMKMIPDAFITSNDSITTNVVSTNLSLLPPPFASGFGVARRVYAAGGQPAGGGGKCAFVKKVVVPALRRTASFTRDYLWRRPWKVVTAGMVGNI